MIWSWVALQHIVISGDSMIPALRSGDHVLVTRIFFRLRVGDIVSVKDPRDGKVLIKRIHAINGKLYDVRGDNKSASTDSRSFGMIGRRGIIGKVIYHSK